jgi:hypothetical protein
MCCASNGFKRRMDSCYALRTEHPERYGEGRLTCAHQCSDKLARSRLLKHGSSAPQLLATPSRPYEVSSVATLFHNVPPFPRCSSSLSPQVAGGSYDAHHASEQHERARVADAIGERHAAQRHRRLLAELPQA